MISEKEILEDLRELAHSNGMTQQKLAAMSGTAQSYICDLLNGKKEISGITLRKLISLFPNAELKLNSNSPRMINGNNYGSNCNIQCDTNNYLSGDVGDIEQFRSGLISAIIMMELDPSSKEAVLKLVSQFQKEEE